jgi:fatty-acyl-CoA synthase
MGTGIGDVLDQAAARWSDREVLLIPHQGIRWTRHEVHRKARKLAAGLLALRLKPSDRLGMLAPDHVAWLLVQFGTAYAGLILVNINLTYRPPALAFALNKVGFRTLMLEDQ